MVYIYDLYYSHKDASVLALLETEAMKESITKCFKREGMLDEVRLQST